MSECEHRWFETLLVGHPVEQCDTCYHIRKPRMTESEARAARERVAAELKRVFSDDITDFIPRVPQGLVDKLDWKPATIGARYDTPRVIPTRNTAVTHIDGVTLLWVKP